MGKVKNTLIVLFAAFSISTLLLGGRCNVKNKQCQVSADCPGKQICGPKGYCVPQCKTTRDCPQYQRCIEGECKPIQ